MEINLRKIKWLLFGGYRSDHPNYGTAKETYQLTSAVDKYNSYDKFLIAGELNITDEEVLEDFMSDLNAKCIIKGPTCFKSDTNPSKIDLVVPRRRRDWTLKFSPLRSFARPVLRSSITIRRNFLKFCTSMCFHKGYFLTILLFPRLKSELGP